MMSSDNSILMVKDLCKDYIVGSNKVQALRKVNFELKKEELAAIMGPSGSGKSTLLNVISGLDSPTSGKVFINGDEIKDYYKEPFATKYRRDNIGFIFQFFNLLNDLTIEENIALPLILKNIKKDEIEERTRKMLELVGLTRWKKHRPVELSGGQQQRVAIARALISEPSILLGDEPTGNLDYNTSKEILDLIVRTRKELKQSIIIVTHDPRVAAYCDRVLFFRDGSIVDECGMNSGVSEKDKTDVIFEKFKKLIEVK